MRPTGRVLVAFLLATALGARGAEVGIGQPFAGRAETLLPTPALSYQAVVTPDGGLRYGDGVRIGFAVAGDLAFPAKAAPARKLLADGLPIVVTTAESDKLALEVTAFAASSPPLDCVRVVLRNKAGAALAPILRVNASGATGKLPAPLMGFQRDGAVIALCETRDGKPEAAPAPKPKQFVFQQRGGQAMPNWAKPKVPCDPGFRNIVAGMQEAATFLLKAEAGKSYVVAVGLCESHWQSPGNRICDILVERKKVATVDPVAKPYGPDVPFVLTFPTTDENRDGWIEVTSVANRASPDQNSIINAIWLFEEAVGKGLQPSDILSGGANDKAACYVACGSTGAAAPQVATLDFRFDLQPNASATLWLKKPRLPVKTADAPKLAESDGAKLLAVAQQAWSEARSKANWILLGDTATTNALFLAYVNLRCLCSHEGAATTVRPDPFSAAFSPRASALAATALDRLGAHADAAAILAGLVARQGDDRLWTEGDEQWSPTGHVLNAFAFHFDLTGDRPWLEASYRPLLSSAEAILEARELSKWIAHDSEAVSHGLMPTAAYGAVPPEDWIAHTVSAAVGVDAVAQLARALEKPNDYLWLKDNLREMQACILRASKQHGGALLAETKGVGPLAEEAAGYITLVRDALVREQGDELHLLPNVPKAWLSKEVAVTNLPTAFGPLSYKAALSADGRKLIVEPQLQARRQPKAIVVHPPLPAGDAKPLVVTDFRGGKLELDLK